MSKKTTRPQVSNSYVRFQPQKVVEERTIDELAIFSDEELGARMGFLANEAYDRRLPQFSYEARPFEVEMAYVQREQGIRQARRVAHRKYMDDLRAAEVDENSLPEYQGNVVPSWLF